MTLLSPEYLKKHFLPVPTWWDKHPDRLPSDFAGFDTPRGVDPAYKPMTAKEEEEYFTNLPDDAIF